MSTSPSRDTGSPSPSTSSVPAMLCADEDEPIFYFEREGTEADARRAARRILGEPSGYVVHRRYLRPWRAEEDCEATTHDEDEREDGDCTCAMYEEGWMFECARTHPNAVPAWRVEWIG